MTIHCKTVEQYFTVVLFVFQFYPVCDLVSVLDLALSRVKGLILKYGEVIHCENALVLVQLGQLLCWHVGVKGVQTYVAKEN